MNIEKEGEKLGREVYKRIARDYKNLSYAEFRVLVDQMYAGIYGCAYERTYNKGRGTEHWNDDGNE